MLMRAMGKRRCSRKCKLVKKIFEILLLLCYQLVDHFFVFTVFSLFQMSIVFFFPCLFKYTFCPINQLIIFYVGAIGLIHACIAWYCISLSRYITVKMLFGFVFIWIRIVKLFGAYSIKSIIWNWNTLIFESHEYFCSSMEIFCKV